MAEVSAIHTQLGFHHIPSYLAGEATLPPHITCVGKCEDV